MDDFETLDRDDEQYGVSLDTGWMTSLKGQRLAREAETLINLYFLRRDSVESKAYWCYIPELITALNSSSGTGRKKVQTSNEDEGNDEDEEGDIPLVVGGGLEYDRLIDIKSMGDTWKLKFGAPLPGEVLSALCVRFGPPNESLQSRLDSATDRNLTATDRNYLINNAWEEFSGIMAKSVCHLTCKINVRSLAKYCRNKEAELNVAEYQISRSEEVMKDIMNEDASNSEVLKALFSRLGLPGTSIDLFPALIASAKMCEGVTTKGGCNFACLFNYSAHRAAREDNNIAKDYIESILNVRISAPEAEEDDEDEAEVWDEDAKVDAGEKKMKKKRNKRSARAKHVIEFFSYLVANSSGAVNANDLERRLVDNSKSYNLNQDPLYIKALTRMWSRTRDSWIQSDDVENFISPQGYTLRIKMPVGSFNSRGKLRPRSSTDELYALASKQLFFKIRQLKFSDPNLRVPSDIKIYSDPERKIFVPSSKSELLISYFVSDSKAFVWSDYVMELLNESADQLEMMQAKQRQEDGGWGDDDMDDGGRFGGGARYKGTSTSGASQKPGTSAGKKAVPSSAGSSDYVKVIQSSKKAPKPAKTPGEAIQRMLKLSEPVYMPPPPPFIADVTEAHKWGIPLMCKYLIDEIELPDYIDVFQRHEMTGWAFICLDEEKVAATLEIKHAMHASKLAMHAQLLREKVLEVAAIQRPKSLKYWEPINLAGWLRFKHHCPTCALRVLQAKLDGATLLEMSEETMIDTMGGTGSDESQAAVTALKELLANATPVKAPPPPQPKLKPSKETAISRRRRKQANQESGAGAGVDDVEGERKQEMGDAEEGKDEEKEKEKENHGSDDVNNAMKEVVDIIGKDTKKKSTMKKKDVDTSDNVEESAASHLDSQAVESSDEAVALTSDGKLTNKKTGGKRKKTKGGGNAGSLTTDVGADVTSLRSELSEFQKLVETQNKSVEELKQLADTLRKEKEMIEEEKRQTEARAKAEEARLLKEKEDAIKESKKLYEEKMQADQQAERLAEKIVKTNEEAAQKQKKVEELVQQSLQEKNAAKEMLDKAKEIMTTKGTLETELLDLFPTEEIDETDEDGTTKKKKRLRRNIGGSDGLSAKSAIQEALQIVVGEQKQLKPPSKKLNFRDMIYSSASEELAIWHRIIERYKFDDSTYIYLDDTRHLLLRMCSLWMRLGNRMYNDAHGGSDAVNAVAMHPGLSAGNPDTADSHKEALLSMELCVKNSLIHFTDQGEGNSNSDSQAHHYYLTAGLVFVLGLVKRLLEKYGIDQYTDLSKITPQVQAQIFPHLMQMRKGVLPFMELSRENFRSMVEDMLGFTFPKWSQFDAVCQRVDPDKKGFINAPRLISVLSCLSPLMDYVDTRVSGSAVQSTALFLLSAASDYLVKQGCDIEETILQVMMTHYKKVPTFASFLEQIGEEDDEGNLSKYANRDRDDISKTPFEIRLVADLISTLSSNVIDSTSTSPLGGRGGDSSPERAAVGSLTLATSSSHHHHHHHQVTTNDPESSFLLSIKLRGKECAHGLSKGLQIYEATGKDLIESVATIFTTFLTFRIVTLRTLLSTLHTTTSTPTSAPAATPTSVPASPPASSTVTSAASNVNDVAALGGVSVKIPTATVTVTLTLQTSNEAATAATATATTRLASALQRSRHTTYKNLTKANIEACISTLEKFLVETLGDVMAKDAIRRASASIERLESLLSELIGLPILPGGLLSLVMCQCDIEYLMHESRDIVAADAKAKLQQQQNAAALLHKKKADAKDTNSSQDSNVNAATSHAPSLSPPHHGSSSSHPTDIPPPVLDRLITSTAKGNGGKHIPHAKREAAAKGYLSLLTDVRTLFMKDLVEGSDKMTSPGHGGGSPTHARDDDDDDVLLGTALLDSPFKGLNMDMFPPDSPLANESPKRGTWKTKRSSPVNMSHDKSGTAALSSSSSSSKSAMQELMPTVISEVDQVLHMQRQAALVSYLSFLNSKAAAKQKLLSALLDLSDASKALKSNGRGQSTTSTALTVDEIISRAKYLQKSVLSDMQQPVTAPIRQLTERVAKLRLAVQERRILDEDKSLALSLEEISALERVLIQANGDCLGLTSRILKRVQSQGKHA